MKHYYLFLLSLFFLTSCHDEPMWYDNEYVFLEQHKSIYSEKICGVFNPSLLYVDFPMYIFDQGTKALTGEVSLTDKIQMVLGTGESHSGIASSGAGTGLEEVHSLPHLGHGITVENIDENGTVYFTYKDSSMTLAPDEEWSTTWTKLDTSFLQYEDWDNYTGFGDVEILMDTMIILWTYHDRVTNWGLLEKNQFVNWDDYWGL
ncbi:hypothetical protein OU798_08890 [Prolixibacteraceae bacterium Z1-6]|uniref:Uncharacterized protein n=1 Tax=Draconibacterium aestuarii TaxID=2998507 RepID=A0A9X3F4J6_9BACT|nr:hypothetical protein [Prolixibacteraceae bacterium Z1-6]